MLLRKILGLIVISGSLFTSSASWAQIFVGNGGDGFLVKDKVYLRDFDYGSVSATGFFGRWIYSQPRSIGLKVSPFVSDRLVIPSSLENVGLPQDTLARKLTDLSDNNKLMSLHLMKIINLYDWVFYDQPLPLLEPNDPSLSPLKNAQRVQIAIRQGTKITISKFYWKKMSDVDKVGLILHEALFAFIKPQCLESDSRVCRQSVSYVRRFVANSFMNPMDPQLNLKSAFYFSERLFSDAFLAEHLLAYEFVPKDRQKTKVKSSHRDDMDIPSRRRALAPQICRSWKSVKDAYDLVLTAQRPPLFLGYGYYPTSYGTQAYISILDRTASESLSLSYEAACENSELLKALDYLF